MLCTILELNKQTNKPNNTLAFACTASSSGTAHQPLTHQSAFCLTSFGLSRLSKHHFPDCAEVLTFLYVWFLRQNSAGYTLVKSRTRILCQGLSRCKRTQPMCRPAWPLGNELVASVLEHA